MNLYGASGHAKVVIDILKKTGNTIDLIIDDNRDIKKILDINVV